MADAITAHLADAERRWSPTTHDDAARVAARLPDAFGATLARNVTPATLTALYASLTRDGWSPHRIRRAHMVIGLALGDCVVHGDLRHNPAREVRVPSVSRPKVHAPSDDQVRDVRAAASGDLLDFLVLATATGARRGELVALQWGDIDWNDGTVNITRSLAQKVGAAPAVRPTKTGSKGHRTLAVGARAMDVLRRRHDEAVVRADAHRLAAPVWIFTHDAGMSPWRPDHASRLFLHARRRAGIEDVRLHDLRHHVATSMLRDGEPAIVVAQQLGHSTVATTLSTYSHYMPGEGGDAADRREGRLG